MTTKNNSTISLNRLAKPLVESLVADAEVLRLVVTKHPSGTRIVDAGIACPGGIEAGRRIAEICMGGLGRVSLVPYAADTASQPAPAFAILVESSQPVLACLASQYAGWTLSGEGFYALGSGPARALWAGEELYGELQYHDREQSAVLVIETDQIPPDSVITEIAAKARVEAEDLTLVLTPTTSLAGGVQVVARSLEVALHKAHSLHYPLDQIIDGVAVAPLPPPCSDFMTAMGRTNDAILYGATVQLFVTGTSEQARDLAEKMPSNTSRDYGRGFATIFADYNHDFYKIDPLLFSPARIVVTAVASGQSYQRGSLNPAVLRQSFDLS
ncbi:MAG: methenyltetrahydromethanopterin cyclohydrolase [Candidatus Pacebacteria bacterium]|nr:methenyltetrahydromethanopterin cyclohydrolase [Candidatus Paceibacterota bacterium]